MANEGTLLVQLYPGPVLELSQSQKIAADWETGKIPVDATDIEI
jgi:hypothetical protein